MDSLRSLLVISLMLMCSCSIGLKNKVTETNSHTKNSINFNKSRYLTSGKVVLSYKIPETLASNKTTNFDIFSTDTNQFDHINTDQIKQPIKLLCDENTTKNKLELSPLVGFFPITAMFKPADNEVWIELNKNSKLIEIYKGQEKIKEIKGEGEISLAPGEYPLQHKQRNPLWYAPDEYFTKRELKVPPKGDHFRYRRGALGPYALYPTMDFIIHSGPFWSSEVGGFKVEESDLASIFLMLNTGTTIVVK